LAKAKSGILHGVVWIRLDCEKKVLDFLLSVIVSRRGALPRLDVVWHVAIHPCLSPRRSACLHGKPQPSVFDANTSAVEKFLLVEISKGSGTAGAAGRNRRQQKFGANSTAFKMSSNQPLSLQNGGVWIQKNEDRRPSAAKSYTENARFACQLL